MLLCFFHAARSCLRPSSISSLMRFASSSRFSRAAFSSELSPGGGAIAAASGSSGSLERRALYIVGRRERPGGGEGGEGKREENINKVERWRWK